MYYVQDGKYGYKKEVEGGVASVRFGKGNITEISKEDYERGIAEDKRSFNERVRLSKERRVNDSLEDYNALIAAGIPDSTARRLTQYYGTI